MLAHELRNPLAPIRNSLQILMMKFAGDPDMEHVGGIMTRQVALMSRLVDDLIDMSRISQGKIELRKATVPLTRIISRAVETVTPAIEERQHHLDVQLPAEQMLLDADSARLEQVVGNLLNNAAKYTPPGGRIRLEATREGNEVLIRVRDNGIGIRPEMQAQIFELFAQADRVAGRVSEGLGIGLTLVRSLVEMHGGKVSVSSARDPAREVNSRSVFLSCPPAGWKRNSFRPSRRQVRHCAFSSRTTTSTPPRVLAMLLRLLGHEVRTAYHGQQALDTARGFRPQAILLDIGLPKGMDGYELARRLRQEPGLENVLLIALSGYGQPSDIARARAAGMNHHLPKPADLTALLRMLATVSPPPLVLERAVRET